MTNTLVNLVFSYFMNSQSTDCHTSYNNYCSERDYEGVERCKLDCVKSVNSGKHDKVVLPLEAVGSSFGGSPRGFDPLHDHGGSCSAKEYKFFGWGTTA